MEFSKKTKYRYYSTIMWLSLIPFTPVFIVLFFSDRIANIATAVNDFLWEFKIPDKWIHYKYAEKRYKLYEEERKKAVDKLHNVRVEKIQSRVSKVQE